MARTGFFATAVFTFVFVWNDFLFALVLTRTEVDDLHRSGDALFRRPVEFLGEDRCDVGARNAAGLLHRRFPAALFRARHLHGRGQGLRKRPWQISRSSALHKILRADTRCARRRSYRPGGRVRRPRRAVRLRQEHAAADDRRPRGGGCRHDRNRRARRQRPAPEGPRHRHGLPELRALSLPHGVRERRLRSARPQGARAPRSTQGA